MMDGTWTPEIYELVETLTCRVKVLSLEHVQKGWGDRLGSPTGVIQIVEQLVRSQILVGDVWMIQPTPLTDLPLVRWSPGTVCPEMDKVEMVVRDRWNCQSIPTPVVAASYRAARLFGSNGGGLPPVNHRNHDLLLSAVYLRYRTAMPSMAEHWLGEHAIALAERGVKNPDAFFVDDSGAIDRAIESAGRYSLDQLDSFHEHCRIANLPYELW